MHREGHLGMSFIIYSPLGAIFLAFGAIDIAVLGGAIVVTLSMLPDYDQRIPLVKHRGITHTLWFAVAVGLILGAIALLIGLKRGGIGWAGIGFILGFTSVVSHLAGDVITPTGVKPFHPLSEKRFTLNLTRASNPVANYALLVMGVVVLAGTGWLAEKINGLMRYDVDLISQLFI